VNGGGLGPHTLSLAPLDIGSADKLLMTTHDVAIWCLQPDDAHEGMSLDMTLQMLVLRPH